MGGYKKRKTARSAGLICMICNKCLVEKPLSEFGNHKRGKNGYRHSCKECNRTQAKEWASKNREKTKQYKTKWRLKNPNKMYLARKASRFKNGFEKYLESDVLDQYGVNCHICSLPIDLNAARLPGAPGWEYGLHIDHVIPIMRGGADVLQNVRPSHGLCNLKKGIY